MKALLEAQTAAPESTVFVVDDDETALASIRWLLESDGLSVEIYRSASEFLSSDGPQRPGCVVLDLRLPEMDGLALQEQLAARGARPPIIFVSGHGDVPQCAEAMKAGAVDFLEKPADGERILGVVREALERDRRRRSAEADTSELTARIGRLTPRERDVMRRLYQGDSIKRMATAFGISFQTVAKHRVRVLEKLEVRNEAELVRLLVDYPLDE